MKPKQRRNPVARALRRIKPKVVRNRKIYTRKHQQRGQSAPFAFSANLSVQPRWATTMR